MKASSHIKIGEHINIGNESDGRMIQNSLDWDQMRKLLEKQVDQHLRVQTSLLHRRWQCHYHHIDSFQVKFQTRFSEKDVDNKVPASHLIQLVQVVICDWEQPGGSLQGIRTAWL